MHPYRDIYPHASRDNRLLNANGKRVYYPAMPKLFREALIDALEATGKSLASVAEDADVSCEQLKKVKQGKSGSTNVDDAVRVANVFAMSLDEFIGDDTRAKRQEILELYNSLDETEKVLLLAAARGFHAQARAGGR